MIRRFAIRRFAAFFLVGLLLVALSACEDPTGVGLGVGKGFEGGVPVTVRLAPATFQQVEVSDVTGNSNRVLAGRVNDPAVGATAAWGHLDVSPPSTLTPGFVNGEVESAALVLVPEYVYGDTLQTATLDVYGFPDEWDASARFADNPVEAGTRITTSAAFEPGDTLSIDLPSSWAPFSTLNDTTDFDENFHGFQLRSASGNAVVGYSRAASGLQVVAGGDTTTYGLSKSFTSVSHPDVPELPNRRLVQDGAGYALSFDFALPDSLKNRPVSRAVLRLPADRAALSTNLPSDFVRPFPDAYILQGFFADSTSAFAVTDSLNADGVFDFSANTNVALQQIFEAMALGDSTISYYRLYPSQAANTVSPMLFFGPEAAPASPHVELTVTTSN